MNLVFRRATSADYSEVRRVTRETHLHAGHFTADHPYMSVLDNVEHRAEHAEALAAEPPCIRRASFGPARLSRESEEIASVIWATGYGLNFTILDVPVLDQWNHLAAARMSRAPAAQEVFAPAGRGDHFYPWFNGGSISQQNFVAVCSQTTLLKFRTRIRQA